MSEHVVPTWLCACGSYIAAVPGDPTPIGDLAAVEGWTEVGDGSHYCPLCLAELEAHEPEPRCATCGSGDREIGPWCPRCYAIAAAHAYLRLADHPVPSELDDPDDAPAESDVVLDLGTAAVLALLAEIDGGSPWEEVR